MPILYMYYLKFNDMVDLIEYVLDNKYDYITSVRTILIGDYNSYNSNYSNWNTL